jgi:hypothetical protein
MSGWRTIGLSRMLDMLPIPFLFFLFFFKQLQVNFLELAVFDHLF